MSFYLNFEPPTLKTSLKIKELSFKQFRDLNKYILSDKNEFIEYYFNNILFENLENKNFYYKLSNFDKFCCLLLLRSVSISPELEMFQKKQNVKISVTDFLNSCLNFKQIFNKTITHQNLEVIFGLPNNFIIENFLELPHLMIKSVKIDDSTYNFDDIEINLKNEIIESLPGNVIFEIKTFFDEVVESFKNLEFKIPTLDEALVLNPYDGTLLELLKLVFRANLSNIYEMQYILVSKLHYTPEYLDNNTFAENLLVIRLFEDEIKRQEEQSKKSKTPNIPINPGKL